VPAPDEIIYGKFHWRALPPMRYQSAYLWFVFVSSLDIMLTWAILQRDGTEVNPIAALVIDLWGLPGAIGFKFSLMTFVIIACEWIGRKRDQLARRLIVAATLVSAMPVAWSIALLLMHAWSFEPV